jgi:hypothetical protein
MKKILIIEPRRMLRQAMILNLVPEYEVELGGTVDGVKVDGFDAVLVDYAALREGDAFSGASLSAMQAWRIPTVLIEGDDPASISDRAGLVRVKAPVGREALSGAVGVCLGAPPNESTPEHIQPAASVLADIAVRNEAADGAAAVIELTDVVEEKS